jgi:hypothetical protein
MGMMRKSLCSALIALLLDLGPAHAVAQLKGHYYPGFSGIENGTQPPPGLSLFTTLYFYTSNNIKDDEGVAHDLFRVNAFDAELGFAWVLPYQLLGGNLGGSVVPLAFTKSRLEGASFDAPNDFSFTDISLQPVQLGWHKTRADFLTGYTLFMPSGKYEFGGSDNSGLGMWSHLFQAGTTLRLDVERSWSFSTLGSYELHSKKKHTDIRVGQIGTLEGGLAHTWYRMTVAGGTEVPSLITNVGLVYYWQFKATGDEGPLLTPLLAGRRDRAIALGWEVSAAIPASKMALGFRALSEFGARNRPEGWTFLLSAAYVLEPLN